MFRRARTGARQLGQLLILVGRLPAKIAHELTHLVFLAPWLHSWRIEIEHTSTECVADLDEDIPRWGLVLGHLAPAVVGSTLAVAMLSWVALEGWPIPQTLRGWGKMGVALMIWAAYSWPSEADRNPELSGGGQDD